MVKGLYQRDGMGVVRLVVNCNLIVFLKKRYSLLFANPAKSNKNYKIT